MGEKGCERERKSENARERDRWKISRIVFRTVTACTEITTKVRGT